MDKIERERKPAGGAATNTSGGPPATHVPAELPGARRGMRDQLVGPTRPRARVIEGMGQVAVWPPVPLGDVFWPSPSPSPPPSHVAVAKRSPANKIATYWLLTERIALISLASSGCHFVVAASASPNFRLCCQNTPQPRHTASSTRSGGRNQYRLRRSHLQKERFHSRYVRSPCNCQRLGIRNTPPRPTPFRIG